MRDGVSRSSVKNCAQIISSRRRVRDRRDVRVLPRSSGFLVRRDVRVRRGERLDRERLLAPYDPVLLDELFARIRAEVPVDVAHLAEQSVVGTDLDLLPLSDDADVVPTSEGMRWRWSPYRHITGSIDAIVPWDVLETVRVG